LVLAAAGQEWTTTIDVGPDPRIDFAPEDREARWQALMRLYELAEPVYLAGVRTTELQRQIVDVQALLRDREAVPEELTEEVKALAVELTELQEAMGPLRQATRLSGAIEGSATRPTDDQLWQIDEAWTDATEAIERVNAVIERMPALNRMLNENGVRPEVGEAVPVPRRPGG